MCRSSLLSLSRDRTNKPQCWLQARTSEITFPYSEASRRRLARFEYGPPAAAKATQTPLAVSLTIATRPKTSGTRSLELNLHRLSAGEQQTPLRLLVVIPTTLRALCFCGSLKQPNEHKARKCQKDHWPHVQTLQLQRTPIAAISPDTRRYRTQL